MTIDPRISTVPGRSLAGGALVSCMAEVVCMTACRPSPPWIAGMQPAGFPLTRRALIACTKPEAPVKGKLDPFFVLRTAREAGFGTLGVRPCSWMTTWNVLIEFPMWGGGWVVKGWVVVVLIALVMLVLVLV